MRIAIEDSGKIYGKKMGSTIETIVLAQSVVVEGFDAQFQDVSLFKNLLEEGLPPQSSPSFLSSNIFLPKPELSPSEAPFNVREQPVFVTEGAPIQNARESLCSLLLKGEEEGFVLPKLASLEVDEVGVCSSERGIEQQNAVAFGEFQQNPEKNIVGDVESLPQEGASLKNVQREQLIVKKIALEKNQPVGEESDVEKSVSSGSSSPQTQLRDESIGQEGLLLGLLQEYVEPQMIVLSPQQEKMQSRRVEAQRKDDLEAPFLKSDASLGIGDRNFKASLKLGPQILVESAWQKSELSNSEVLSIGSIPQAEGPVALESGLNANIVPAKKLTPDILQPNGQQSFETSLKTESKLNSLQNLVPMGPQKMFTVENQAGVRFHMAPFEHKDGVQIVRVSILPEHLGNIKIEFLTHSVTNQTEARFTFSQQDGFDLLQGNRQELIGLLQKAGFDLQEDQMRFELSDSGSFLGQSQNGQEDNNHSAHKHTTNEGAGQMYQEGEPETQEIVETTTLLYVEA